MLWFFSTRLSPIFIRRSWKNAVRDRLGAPGFIAVPVFPGPRVAKAPLFRSTAFLMILEQVLKRVVFVSFLLSLWLIPQAVRGQTLYWDNFFGGPGGPWDTNQRWNADPLGFPLGSQTQWAQGDSAVFSAPGLGATGSFNVTLSQNVIVANLTYTGGNVGSTLSLLVGGGDEIITQNATMNVTVEVNRTLLIAPAIVAGGNGGSLVLQSGTLVLTGPNTYSGGTTILGNGIISVGNDAELGAALGAITLQSGELLTTGAAFSSARAINLNAAPSDDTLAAATGTTATYTGRISGLGGLTVGDGGNAGTVVLTGTNTYSGNTLIHPLTTLQIGTGGTTGSILGNVADDGKFVFNRSNAITFSGNVSGTGSLSQIGTGTLILTGTNTYTGGTTVSAGVLSVANDTNLGKVTGGITLQGGELLTSTNGFATGRLVTLNLSGSANTLAAATGTTATYTGLVFGIGGLAIGDHKGNSGTVVLTDVANSYRGGTIIQGGATLSVASDPMLGNTSGGLTIRGGEFLTTGKMFSSARLIGVGPGADIIATATGTTASYSGVLSGVGTLVVGDSTHAGTVVLAANNTYGGDTLIELGTLLLDNAQALGTGDVTVNGGVLGADPQPINVKGNYTQNAGGTLQLQVAGANPGQYDSLNIGGNAALGGTLQLVSLGFAPVAGNKLTLVTTGGAVEGRFAQFVNPFATGPGFNTVDLVYGSNTVLLEFLNLAPPVAPVIITTDFSSFALTPNQSAAANLLDAVQLDPRAANLISFLNTEPFANLPNDFQKISPDGLTAFYEISFSNANMQKLTLEGRFDDIHNGSNGFSSNMRVNSATVNLEDRADADGKSSKAVVEPILQHASENRWGVWVTGFGDFVNVDGDGNAQGYNFTTGGVSLGVDYRITDQLAIGVMGDYSHTWTSLNPSGHIDVDSGRGGLYATWYNHGIYINGAIYGGHNNYDSGRAGLEGLANASTEGAEWSTFIGGGYDFHSGQLTAGPIASLQYTDVGIDSFSEKGSLAPLAVHSGSAESLRSDLGFRLFYQWQIGKMVVEPSLKAAWEHEYKYSALPITAGFAGIPGPSSTFFGPSEGHDSAVVSAGVSVQLTPAISTYVNYDGQLGRGNYDSNAVTGGVRINF